MTDLAFNNYCIACDQLCSHNSIYCSEECKSRDENQFSNPLEQHSHSQEELVSPLLTPSLYQHCNNYTVSSQLNNSPLSLARENSNDFELSNYHFDLNYSVLQTKPTNSPASNISGHLPSTSHNYRKWLTACL